MKITIKGWLTPEGYNGIVVQDQRPNVPVKVDLEVEADVEKVVMALTNALNGLAEAIDG
jgi:hypothetical protein